MGYDDDLAGDDALERVLDEWRLPSDPPGSASPRFTRDPFSLGVASGSPLTDSVVLWTRLAPDPLAGGGLGSEAISVRWELSGDERFRSDVRRGRADALPGRGHSVHVEVDGLDPARWYWYRFFAGNEASPVGRTRTAPAPDAHPRRLRLGFGSCQMFEQGYFSAHRHMLDEDIELMVFLGDYIYESSWGSDLVRRHSGGEPRTLAEYRTRHAQYKTDPDLQRLHAAVPWLVTWDDHEVDNDYADERSEDSDPAFLARRAAAYQAYFEHMPLREPARPRGSDMRLNARYDFGRLARVHVLDGRQYRSPQACPRPGRGGSNVVDDGCRTRSGEERTMLGRGQERWLQEGLREAPGRWNILAQQTLMATAAPVIGGRRRYWTDAWDGYPAARRRLLDVIDDDRLRSCLVLTGDAHTSFVCDLRVDPERPDAPVVATEVCGTSITSQGRPQAQADEIRRANPHIHFADSTRRGYTVLELTPELATFRLRVLDDVKDPATAVRTRATFEVQAGRPGARQAPRAAA